MTIQLTQVCTNNVYKDDMHITISNDNEIENLLYLKFYNNINKITVELLQTAKKSIVRKIMLMEHIDKIIYRNADGIKEEINTNRKLIVKIPEKEGNNTISDDAIIKFQQILDISDNTAVFQSTNTISDELLDILQKNETENIRIMDYGKNKYTLQQIREVKSKVREYIECANRNTDKTEMFIELYKKLSKDLCVDNTAEGNIFDIIIGKTTLKGFAEILKYILDEMQIENKIIQGQLSNGEAHSWSQVKVGYIWYNVDLALDSGESETLNYCLKSDEDFYKDHIAFSKNIEICNQTSTYFFVEEIQKEEGFISKLFNKISQIFSRKRIKKLSTGV